MRKNYLAIITLTVSLILLGTREILAQTTPPDFPACSNPQGTLRVQYNSGTHGIVGDSASHSGSDSVYSVDEERTVQCFCTLDGGGIQTNWWKISSLTQNEIDTLVNLGWHFVPSGLPWGLSPDPYMAKNSEYACGGQNSITTASVQGTSTSRSAGAVLGLAGTGGSYMPLIFALFGIVSTFLGIIIWNRRNSAEA